MAGGDEKRNLLEPYKIGIMMDMPGFPGASDMFPEAVTFALEEAFDNGLIDRPVITVLNEYPGQPYGDGLINRRAYLDLVENEQVLGIAGPLTSDNSLAVLGLIEDKKVPCITICGTKDFVGQYAFNVSNGNLADEPAFIAAWLRSQGHITIAVLRDYPSRIGVEYTQFLEYAAQIFGLSIILVANIAPSPDEESMTQVMAKLKSVSPDAIVYLGFGEACRLLNVGLKNIDWDPPKVMTTAFVSATYNEYRARDIEGWYGIDQYDERNTRFSEMLSRYKAKKGKEMVPNSATSVGYDIGRLYALALSRMEIATPEALAGALETVRMLPAMTGGLGSYITFGPWDHRGLKGLDYLNVRRSVNGTTEPMEFTFQTS